MDIIDSCGRFELSPIIAGLHFVDAVLDSIVEKVMMVMFNNNHWQSYGHGMVSGYKNSTLRLWQSSGAELHAHNFMLPLFITDESPDARLDDSWKDPSNPIPYLSTFSTTVLP